MIDVERERRNDRPNRIVMACTVTWIVLLVASVVGAIVSRPGDASMPFVYAMGGLVGVAVAAVFGAVVFALNGGGV